MGVNWKATYDSLYRLRTTREIVFRRAVLSGGQVSYPASTTFKAGIRYREAGFDPIRGVLYPESRIEVLIWLRDWFGRTEDGATPSEIRDMVVALRGDVLERSREHWSRFDVDGAVLKYDRHALDERPDGVVFAVIVTLQAAE